MTFNQGQIGLIENIQKSNFTNLEPLLFMLKVWKEKLEKDQSVIDKKYEVKN